MSIHPIGCSVILSLAWVSTVAAAPLTEAFGGFSRVTGGGVGFAPQGGYTGIVLGNHADMPPAAQQDLIELNLALPAPIRSGELSFYGGNQSQDGMGFAVSLWNHAASQSKPPGVWIWPDWRDAANVVHFTEFNNFEWLSNHHVRLNNRNSDSAPNHRVIHLDAPTEHFKFTGFQLDFLRAADNGRWACLTNRGTLVVGQLDHGDPQWMTNVIQIPLSDPVSGLLFVQGGNVLMVETKVGENRRLSSYALSPTAAQLVQTVDGSYSSEHDLVSTDGFFGTNHPQGSDDLKLFTVTAGGVISVTPVSFDASEVSVTVSPSGKYVLTQKRAWDGGIDYFMRKTPKAAADDPLPVEPPQTRGALWLSWAP